MSAEDQAAQRRVRLTARLGDAEYDEGESLRTAMRACNGNRYGRAQAGNRAGADGLKAVAAHRSRERTGAPMQRIATVAGGNGGRALRDRCSNVWRAARN
jgi:hypothetical protein